MLNYCQDKIIFEWQELRVFLHSSLVFSFFDQELEVQSFLYKIFLEARPRSFLAFSILATFGVCFLTFPALSRVPCCFPMKDNDEKQYFIKLKLNKITDFKIDPEIKTILDAKCNVIILINVKFIVFNKTINVNTVCLKIGINSKLMCASCRKGILLCFFNSVSAL